MFSAVAGGAAGQDDCKAVEFPDLPDYYIADLQYNVAKKDRLGARSCPFGSFPHCGLPPRGPPPTHNLGRTFEITEAFDSRLGAANLESFNEFDNGNGTAVREIGQIVNK